ncbi:MAG: hypothetical protein Q8L02_06890 [Candidatus Nitrotoga sp.]|nr:hypothetical protein [Candidatus Nitrotoga sp.]
MNKFIKYSVVTTALMMFAGGASAAAFCSAGNPNPDGMSTADVKYNGIDSDDCYGVVVDNDSTALINSTLNLWGASTTAWSFLAKDDGPGVTDTGIFSSINFDLTAATGTSGLWTLTGTPIAPATLPIYLDFIVVLKASDRFGAWLLDDVVFDGSDGGTWAINFTKPTGNPNNPGSITPDLSHLSLYVRDGTPPPAPDQIAIQVEFPNQPACC